MSRVRLSSIVFAVSLSFTAWAAQAATPASGTVSASTPATWSGGPFTLGVPNQLGCLHPSNPLCDAYALTVNLAVGERFVVAVQGDLAQDDYDLYVYYPNGTEAGRSAQDGGNEAVVIQHTNSQGTGPYQVRVLPFAVTSGSTYQGVAQKTSQTPIDTEDLNTCLEAIPLALGIPGITDGGQTVGLDVAVLLDGVSLNEALQIMDVAAQSYTPLKVDLNVVSYTSVNFTGTEGDAMIQQAKDHFGGQRPAGSDLVYVLTDKDLTTDGDTGLAGLADCIGGVRFAHRAFAVGEASGTEPSPIGPFCINIDTGPEVAAHELGHLMGAHHHYANCVEGLLTGDPTDLSPCTLMFNYVDLQSLNFSILEGAVVRGHTVKYASP